MDEFKPVATWQQAVGMALFILAVVAIANRIGPVKKLVG